MFGNIPFAFLASIADGCDLGNDSADVRKEIIALKTEFQKDMAASLATRQKWNDRWQNNLTDSLLPKPHFLADDWSQRFVGGNMLDAACGLGRGIASCGGSFSRIYGVDVSDVAVHMARERWAEDDRIQWLVADVTQLNWPKEYFGLVTAFGFTDLTFFEKLKELIVPGGMFLYEGFSVRQREVKPELLPAWTTTPEEIRTLFSGWEILACGETGGPPYRVHLAAIRPPIIEKGERPC